MRPSSQNDELLARLKSIECPDSTYPARDPALVFDKAEGSYIWDVEGRRYVDLCAGFGVLALGHNSREVQDVFASRIKVNGERLPITHGMGDVYASRAKIALLEELTRVLPPPLTKTALALSGSQTVEIAIKTAILQTGKCGVIAFDGAYHGLDLGLLPLVSRESFREPFSSWLVTEQVRRLPYGASREEVGRAMAEIQSGRFGLAAVVVEPIQGRAGIRSAPSGWLAMLRALCDRHGALLIFDEVFTGLGRSGRLTFAHEILCDLLCLGKALGGGLPLSACVGTEQVMAAWPASEGEALHTGTFFGHPLACELGMRTLQAIREQAMPERASKLGSEGLRYLRDRPAHCSHLREVRGEGLMLAVEFDIPGLGAKAMDALRAEGLIALASGSHGQSLSLTPALNIPNDIWQEALERLCHLILRLRA